VSTPNDPTISHDSLDAVIAAYMLAAEAGDVPNCQELLDQHLEHAEALQAFFADLDRMDRVASPLRLADGLDATHAVEANGHTELPTVRYFGDYEWTQDGPSSADAGEGVIGDEEDFKVGPTELGIKVLEETGMAKQRPRQRCGADEADNRRPAICFTDPVADLDLHRRVAATQGRAVCQANRSLFGSGKVQSEGRCDPIGEDCIVSAGIQEPATECNCSLILASRWTTPQTASVCRTDARNYWLQRARPVRKKHRCRSRG